ncbi:MAG TPA: TAXI family TRAP transporter solute-binding subunit [Acetobacteraceae bacterium]|nr:TAXI family TRAP transporter solute-binding subunit [Acetobacteraceae bacterium]
MKKIVAALLCALIAVPCMAQQQPREAVAHANQGTIGVITGMEGGTYARTAADLTILDDGTLRVLPINGKGSLQNLSDILYLRGVDIGFVQADALAYAQQHNMFPGLVQSIRYIAKLYDEEIHLLARRDIAKLEDLNGQTINVDVEGSGSAMTAEIVLKALGIKATITHDKQIDGLAKLKNGDIAAVFHVGGAPIPLFADVQATSGLHFLSVPLTQALAQTYLPDQFKHDSYPALVPDGAPVPTIAVGDVMAVYAWQPGSERYTKVTRFVNAFFSRFDEFQRPPRHPKWREVNLSAEVPGWTRFQPAQDWLAHQQVANTQAVQARFNTFLSQTVPAGSKMSEASRDALFQQFLTWDRKRTAAH